MEYFDVLDGEGNRTGRVAEKGSPLGEGEYFLGAHVYIYTPGRMFLLQRRVPDKHFLPDKWEIHMGHTEAGETTRQTAAREVAEEIGLAIDEEALQHIGRVRWERPRHFVDIFFACVQIALDKLTLQSTEVADVKLIPLEEMTDMVRGMDYRPAAYRELLLAHLRTLAL